MILSVVFFVVLLPGLCISYSSENVALGAYAVQSSTAYSGNAKNAVDGNGDTNYHHYSCTHTDSQWNPWWRVELPHAYTIYMVSITNRGDCCEERINGAQIRVGNSLRNNGNNNLLVATIDSLQLGATRTYKFAPVTARYVFIILPGYGKILTLCEVKVFTENVAFGAKAEQSSKLNYLANAMNAVDGNTDPYYSHGSCTHTHTQHNPWWRVELPHAFHIYMVSITNRGDCCEERISGAQIRVGNNPKNNGNNNKLVATISYIKRGATNMYEFLPVVGRFVNIIIPGNTKILTLCEVKVFAAQYTLHNLALRGTTSQSSWQGLTQTPKIRNHNLKKGICTHTAQERYPWWRVDLHDRYTISYVSLTNQRNSNHLEGAEVHIGDSLMNGGKDNPICATVSFIPAGKTEYFDCTKLLKGRYVTIVLPRVGILSLCEVDVFGHSLEEI